MMDEIEIKLIQAVLSVRTARPDCMLCPAQGVGASSSLLLIS